ncbi:unnamed protein product [Leptosia nina]|uniref:Beta-1,4-N-acetylgalactosaminyltransferase n=1 Tax=Leptosia nina TaxID=320188 RepID=A0AAV1K2S3_9NEOP
MGCGRRAWMLKLLLLVVVALAAVEYLFGLRTYLGTPAFNITQSTIETDVRKSQPWFNLPLFIQNTLSQNSTQSMTGQNGTEYVRTPHLLNKIMESLRNLVSEDTTQVNEQSMPVCDEVPPDLGPVTANKTEMELDWVEKKYPEVDSGGFYSPPNCTARHKVAIIVPFRDRHQHLAIFLNHMHPFLMKQQIEYGIFIVEQNDTSAFNRAKLMNIGFVESQKKKPGGWQCFIFHDIDLLPLDSRNLYSCPEQPRHMSASIDKLKFTLPYDGIFGGVSAMTLEQFTKVNGFSNRYWGWGGEDDDMFHRMKKMHYHITRYNMSIAVYTMLDHEESAPNPKRFKLLLETSKTLEKDGLSTLKYDLVHVEQHHLYTHVLANIDERS